MCENDFYIFVSSEPLDLKFATLITLVQRYVSTKLELLSCIEKIGGTGLTDRQTNRRAQR